MCHLVRNVKHSSKEQFNLEYEKNIMHDSATIELFSV